MNPIITNPGLVSRYDEFALASKLTVDGASISADGVLLRGTVLVKQSSNGKWHAFVHGTDTLAADQVRILKDELKVSAAADAYGVGYFEGFFMLSDLLDANSAGGLLLADLTTAAGFHQIESNEVRLK